jgi:hypothetical protein
MSVPRWIRFAVAAVLTVAAVLPAAPAQAAVITDLDCESRLARFHCVAEFEYSGLVTFKWYVDGRYQPLFPEWFMQGQCPGGTSRTVKLVMIDDDGTATRSRSVRCVSGNP